MTVPFTTSKEQICQPTDCFCPFNSNDDQLSSGCSPVGEKSKKTIPSQGAMIDVVTVWEPNEITLFQSK